jgi:hypothetical protein
MVTKAHKIQIAGEEFNLYKTGGDQARQFTKILKWLGKYATPLIDEFSDEEGNITFDNIFDVLMKIAEVVDDETLLSAFDIVIGCNRDFTNENFDINLLADSIEVLVANEAYRSLLNRFFGTRSSNTDTDTSSTPSE